MVLTHSIYRTVIANLILLMNSLTTFLDLSRYMLLIRQCLSSYPIVSLAITLQSVAVGNPGWNKTQLQTARQSIATHCVAVIFIKICNKITLVNGSSLLTWYLI